MLHIAVPDNKQSSRQSMQSVEFNVIRTNGERNTLQDIILLKLLCDGS